MSDLEFKIKIGAKMIELQELFRLKGHELTSIQFEFYKKVSANQTPVMESCGMQIHEN